MAESLPTIDVRAEGKLAVRVALLRVASDLLARDGPQALSMRRIAKLAGCSTGVLYSQFQGKEEIIAALYDEGFGRLQAALEATDRADPLEQVRELNRAYRRFAVANPTHYGVMFARPVPEFSPSEEQLEAAWRSITPLIRALELCVEHRLLASEPEAMALKLWTLAHGLVSAELSGHLLLGEGLLNVMHEEVMGDLFASWSR